MKILKNPEGLVFDTENPDKIEFFPPIKGKPILLHNVTSKSDWDFLSEYFKEKRGVEHPIFRGFSRSYFYSIETN